MRFGPAPLPGSVNPLSALLCRNAQRLRARRRLSRAQRTARRGTGCDVRTGAARCPRRRHRRRHVARCDRIRADPARSNVHRLSSRTRSDPDRAATRCVSPPRKCTAIAAANAYRSGARRCAAGRWRRTSSSPDPARASREHDRTPPRDLRSGSGGAGGPARGAACRRWQRSP